LRPKLSFRLRPRDFTATPARAARYSTSTRKYFGDSVRTQRSHESSACHLYPRLRRGREHSPQPRQARHASDIRQPRRYLSRDDFHLHPAVPHPSTLFAEQALLTSPHRQPQLRLSAVGSPARASTVCPRLHHMFALMHFPIRTSACSLQYIGLALP